MVLKEKGVLLYEELPRFRKRDRAVTHAGYVGLSYMVDRCNVLSAMQ